MYNVVSRCVYKYMYKLYTVYVYNCKVRKELDDTNF